ncbi:MAG TPA: hypothetical protein VHS96_01220, partial [Bacteroidia bacterium]|nr:hypothetical protein [Bacteroidia bacterium]
MKNRIAVFFETRARQGARFACIFLLAITLLPQAATAQAHAGEYMDQIAASYGPIKKDTWDYMVAVANGRSARKIDKRRKELVLSIDAAKSSVARMKPWENDPSYRDSAVAYLRLSKIILLEDYGRIVDMEEVAEQSYDLMEAYLLTRQKANERYKTASAQLQLACADFAARHNVNLLDPENDKLTQKMKQADGVFAHYDQLYLIMFKAQIQETNTITALGTKDISGATQSNNKLAEYAKEGLKNLESVAAYEGDGSLKTATQNLLNFFKNESEQKMSVFIDFYLGQENFEAMRKSIEAKAAKDRTKEDVDNYNKAVTDFNKSLENYNKLNNEANAARAKAINDWNNAGQA